MNEASPVPIAEAILDDPVGAAAGGDDAVLTGASASASISRWASARAR